MENDAKQALHEMGHSISSAAMFLKMQMQTMEAFLKECRDMDNFGHIVDPTLFKDPERRAVSSILQPLCEAAIAFVKTHDRVMARADAALKAVAP